MAISDRPQEPILDPLDRPIDRPILRTSDRRNGFAPVLAFVALVALLGLAYLYLAPRDRDAADLNGTPATTTSVPNTPPPAQAPNP